MEDKSYIKLYRKLLKSPIWENEKALKIWLWCLIKATHTEREQLVGQQLIHLEKGQFIFGREKAAYELNMTESTVYKYIKVLEKLQMININSNNKFSVVSIEKWEEYQVEEQQSNNKGTTKEQQSNTNKNVKNVKNINIYIKEFTNNENLLNTFMDFINYRKQIKKEITTEGIKRIINNFKKWQYTEEECIECLEQSIEKSWTGVFELKNRKPKQQDQQDKEEFKAVDDSNLTREEKIQLMRGEKTMEEFLKEGRVKLLYV